MERERGIDPQGVRRVFPWRRGDDAPVRRSGSGVDLEEVTARGDRVMVVVRTPGVDGYRMWKADDRNYAVFTVREGRIVALRDCRDRREAVAAIE